MVLKFLYDFIMFLCSNYSFTLSEFSCLLEIADILDSYIGDLEDE